jgi:hypothetical protein
MRSMLDSMRPANPSRITVARLSAVASRHAARGTITSHQRAEAVAELAAIAAGRNDLLAQEAGINLGFATAQDGSEHAIRRLAAELCIEAGADPGLVPVWEQEGRERARKALEGRSG